MHHSYVVLHAGWLEWLHSFQMLSSSDRLFVFPGYTIRAVSDFLSMPALLCEIHLNCLRLFRIDALRLSRNGEIITLSRLEKEDLCVCCY